MWVIFSLLAAVFFSIMFLVFKKLEGLGTPLLIFGCSVGTALCFLTHIVANKMTVRIPPSALAWLGLASLLSYCGNYFQTRSLTEGPNAGYTTAIVGCQSVILMVASFYLFGSHISLAKLFGVALCVAGVVVLSFSN
jgi:drug/metabolite transporter (DMT)-like permease